MNPALTRAGGRIATAGALVALLAATSISNAPQSPDGPEAKQLLGELPLSFVENRGQWDTPARFVAKRGPMVARLEPDALVVELRESSDPENAKALVLRLAFENVREDVRLEGEGQQPGVRNYFLGNDPEVWRTAVPCFDSVLYRGLHDGIDLRVRDREGRLEYDLLLAPGADLSRFVVHCEGVESLAVDPDGSLALQTALGPVRQTPPATWYVLPSGERELVECRFALLDEARYGFAIPDRDPSLPVVIDPGIEWSTFLGGSSDDQIFGLAVDGLGVITLGGRTGSPNFPVTDGTMLAGNEDAFVARLDPRQSGAGQLLWATYLGGMLRDRLLRLVADDLGGVYVTGQTSSDNFPTTPGAFDQSANGTWDAFVAKLDAATGALLYSTLLGGFNFDTGTTIALRGPNEVAVGGTTGSDNLPTTPGAFDEAWNGGADGFISILRLDGTGPADLLYSTYLGGSGDDGTGDNLLFPGVTRVGISLAVDSSGDVFATGRTRSTDFPTTLDAYSPTHSGAADVYIARVTPMGAGTSDLVYSTFVGGLDDDLGQAIALESPTVVVVGGETYSADLPTTTGAYDTTFDGERSDAFLLRLDTSQQGTNQLQYSTFLGGVISNPIQGAVDSITDLVLDGAGGCIAVGVTGVFANVTNTFPTTCAAYDSTFNNAADGFIVQMDLAGNGESDLLYSTFVGETIYDILQSVAVVSEGPPAEIVVAGSSSSPGFPTTPGTYDPTFNGMRDGVIVRMEIAPQWSTYCSTAPNSVGPGALISGSCSVSIADNTFELLATGAIPNQFGLFYYGPEQQQVPFGDGFQCVAPGAIGLFRLNPPQIIDPTGAASRLVDFTQPPANAGPGQITAGSTWNFQFWYRDPAGPGGTTFNLSDALSVTFTP